MRILFWGTPEFAVPSLRALVEEGHDVAAVVTQPDREAGRGRKPRASAVKTAALEEGLPLFAPERPKGDSAFLEAIRGIKPDLSVVVAYGHILSRELLDVPERGSVNLHASLLPELRGAAPIHWAIVRGFDLTGVTVMEMTEGMDEGPILLQREVPILPNDTTSGVQLRLAELGAEALLEALALLEGGVLEPRPQEHARATYAPKVTREVARIDWSRPAREVADHIRGMDAVPAAWTLLEGEPIKLFRPLVLEGSTEAAAGTVLPGDAQALVVATGAGGRIRVDEVQAAGKRRMEAGAWLRGRPPIEGAHLS